MQDVMRNVFTPGILEAARVVVRPSSELSYNLRVLSARPSVRLGLDNQMIRHSLLAQRRAWRNYLQAASRAGLLEDQGDIVSRLRTLEGTNFRSAMAECMTAWFFSDQLGLRVSSKPAGRKKRRLDLLAHWRDESLPIEVKAPHRIRQMKVWAGDDADVIQNALSHANRQFARGPSNILVLAPTLLPRLYQQRMILLKALIGRQVLRMTINIETGEAEGDLRPDIVPDGHFTKPIKGGFEPGFKRTSVVVSIEPVLKDGFYKVLGRYLWISYRVDHAVLIAHNPFALKAVDPAVFRAFPQYLRKNDKMIWNDETQVIGR